MLTHATAKFLVIGFGYVWPAYLCYKALKTDRHDVARAWCLYWLVLATFTGLETIADIFVFWVPLYYEAKALFVVFLWHPRTQGALYLYEQFLHPFLNTHEPTIDKTVEDWKSYFFGYISANIGWMKNLVMSKAQVAVDLLRQYQQNTLAANGTAADNDAPQEYTMQYASPQTSARAEANGLQKRSVSMTSKHTNSFTDSIKDAFKTNSASMPSRHTDSFTDSFKSH